MLGSTGAELTITGPVEHVTSAINELETVGAVTWEGEGEESAERYQGEFSLSASNPDSVLTWD